MDIDTNTNTNRTNSLIITDNDVKLELNSKNKNKNKNNNNNYTNNDTNNDNNINDNFTIPRYGTTVDLKTNKVIDNIDKKTLRDKNISTKKTNNRISRISIDSRNRNLDPKNIISNYITINKPFTFTKDSNILYIEMPINHNLKVDSNITITNVLPSINILRATSLQLKKNSKYIYINQPNHGFIGLTNVINISDVKTSNPNNYFFGNIPLTIINGEHNIILIETNGVLDYNNYLIDMGIYSDSDYTYTEDSFTINVMSLNGINLKYINASYPITNEIQQGYHKIIETGLNYIKIKLLNQSSKTSINKEGNDNILIGVILSTTNGYPDPDYYAYDLKKTYYNVKKIKLVSTEFPNSELLVKNVPASLKNNSLYWNILDDGNYIYKININQGNYDALSLQTEITSQISLLKRNFGTYLNSSLYSEYLLPNIIINPSNSIFSMSIMSIVTLSNCVNVSTETYLDSNIRLIITHSNHNLNQLNSITLSGVIGIEDPISTSTVKYYIPLDIINKTHIIESINGINNYVIKLDKYNPTTIKTSEIDVLAGGNAIKILYPLSIRLLFNYNDTLGNILGFKNVSNELSFTNFEKTIANSTPYYSDSNLNSVGLPSYNTPVLQFKTFSYIYMVSEIFSSNINLRDSVGIFAKLFLTGNSGSFIYDQYVQIIDEVPNTFAFLNRLEFKFLTPDGRQYNFNGQDHSYTLELYEELAENMDI